MRSVDIHTHILPPEIPRFADRFGYGGFIQLEMIQNGSAPPCRAKMMRDDGTFFREIEHNCWSSEARLHDCDKAGVGLQVLSTVPVMFSYWAKPQHTHELSQFLNDHLAGVVAKNPRRFVGLGTLPLQDPELSIRELERCVKELGFAGVQIGTHVNDWNLNQPELFPVFQRAEELGAAIFVHPWDMVGQQKMQRYWLPWLVGMPAECALAICSILFGGVLERLPKLRIAFAHGGGAFPGTFGRIQHGFEARPDLCAIDNPHPPSHYLGKFWVDALVHEPHALELILELFGPKAVALGTDYPFPLGEQHPGELIRSLPGLDAETRERLLTLNALEWLGRSARDFDL